MANLTATETLDAPVTRQDLFNLWATSVLGTFPKTELRPEVFTMDVGSWVSAATSTPQPGHMFYSETDGLMYCFHDEIDNTGVSLWLAIGPDRFEVAGLLRGPTAGGAVVQPWYDRWVGVSTGASGRIWNQRAIGTVSGGLNASDLPNTGVALGGTLASGVWAPIAIDGIVFVTTVGTISPNNWIRVTDGSGGIAERAGVGLVPSADDTLGLGIFTLAGTTATPVSGHAVWMGPRVINLL